MRDCYLCTMNIDPVLLSVDFPLVAWIAFSVAFVAALYLLCVMLPQLLKVLRASSSANASSDDTSWLPPASVVVTASSSAWNLPDLVDKIYGQDYPSEIEVIVVDDNSFDDTKDVLSTLQAKYPRLRTTFVPGDSRNLSRKKLSITLGIKAACNDVVVLTAGNCAIRSDKWLRNMMSHFNDESTDIVIGYAAPSARSGNDNDSSKRFRAFDTVWDAVRYLSRVLSRKTFRGNGCNIAYRRDVFFDNKGFSRSLNLNYGDDDIFINEVARRDNTVAELSADSIVDILDEAPAYVHGVNHMRRDFTAGYLPRAPFRLFASFSWAWWLWILASVATVLLTLPSIVAASAVFILACILCLPVMIVWRKTSRALRSRPLLLTVPWFVSLHPLYNLALRIKGFRRRYRNFTWGTIS